MHFFSPNNVATLRVLTVAVKARCSFEVVSSVSCKFGNPYSILQHKSSFIFRFRRKSRTKWCPCLFRRARFTRTPHSFFELCPFCVQAWRFWDILKSKTSFCVTGAGHLTPFHPCGRRGTFCALLKRWQVWVKIGCGFGGHFAGQAQYLAIWCIWTMFWKGRKHRFVKLLSFLISDMMMIPCGRCGTWDRPLSKVQETYVKRRFCHFYSSIFVARANVLEKSKMCSRNLLLTLGLDLAKRVPLESLYRDLLKRSCQETSYRELVQRSCEETSHRDLVQRSCQEVSYGDLAKRAYR